MASIPAVKALEASHKARGLRVVSVTEVDEGDDDDRKRASGAVKKHGMGYPCLLDEEGRWMKSAGMASIPAFMVVDREGTVRFTSRGKLKQGSEAFAKLDAAISKAL